MSPDDDVKNRFDRFSAIRERTVLSSFINRFIKMIRIKRTIHHPHPLMMLHSLNKVPGPYLIEHFHTAAWRPMNLKPKGLNLRKKSSGTVNTSIG